MSSPPFPNHILVFGSLRLNSTRGYNFDRCGKQTYIKTFRLPGYRLHDLGSYPASCIDPQSEITVELHSVSERTAQSINRLELGAGYTGVEIPVEHDGQTVNAKMYTMPAERLTRYPEVKDGNWYPI